jgi:uncharacterized membrane protein YtjA (UPF0391 family)
MLRLALIFLVVAIIAAIFGFTGIGDGLAMVARIVFFVFLVLSAVEFVFEVSLVKKKHERR